MSFKYQWLRNGKPITGAVNKTYQLVSADAGTKISVKVTGAAKEYVSASKTSAKINVPKEAKPKQSVQRFFGADRFATAVEISKKSFPSVGTGVPVVYLADGMNFPDALAGAAAAGRDGGPVLLTQSRLLPGVVVSELKRLQPKRVVVLGGSGAVSNGVRDAVKSAVPKAKVTPLSGNDRFATASEIAGSFNAQVESVFIADGMNFPDALAGAAIAGKQKSPVLLVSNKQIPASIEKQLKRLKPKNIIVLGGPGAVSNKFEKVLKKYFG